MMPPIPFFSPDDARASMLRRIEAAERLGAALVDWLTVDLRSSLDAMGNIPKVVMFPPEVIDRLISDRDRAVEDIERLKAACSKMPNDVGDAMLATSLPLMESMLRSIESQIDLAQRSMEETSTERPQTTAPADGAAGSPTKEERS
jgi:hypothetical protein